jgi:hypothetical protein
MGEKMIVKILLTLILSIASGILGRMGGAEGYDTLYRDVGCSLLSILTFIIWFGFKVNYWWVYLIVFLLHWLAFTTYWDGLFGFDNLWFAGFMVGLALIPLPIIDKTLPFYFVRAILLAIIWGCLNKYLPYQVFIWRRDIAEEFLRYFAVIITYLGVLIK